MGKKARAAKHEGGTVKTTIDLPAELWRAAKIRALDDRRDFREVVIAALEAFLSKRTGR